MSLSIVRTVGVVLSVFLLGSCNAHVGGEARIRALATTADVPFGLALPVPQSSSTVAIGSIMLCRTGSGDDPEISSVGFERGENEIEVVAFGTRRASTTTLGAENGASLTNLGFVGTTVSQGCDAKDDARPTELGIEVRAPGGPRVTGQTLDVHYRAGSSSLVEQVPFTLVVCVGSKRCDP
ncbi:MAG: hypothetical protein V9G19_24720 [Tetrasphaera sp.]